MCIRSGVLDLRVRVESGTHALANFVFATNSLEWQCNLEIVWSGKPIKSSIQIVKSEP